MITPSVVACSFWGSYQSANAVSATIAFCCVSRGRVAFSMSWYQWYPSASGMASLTAPAGGQPPTSSRSTKETLAGRSASRRMYQGNQYSP